MYNKCDGFLALKRALFFVSVASGRECLIEFPPLSYVKVSPTRDMFYQRCMAYLNESVTIHQPNYESFKFNVSSILGNLQSKNSLCSVKWMTSYLEKLNDASNKLCIDECSPPVMFDIPKRHIWKFDANSLQSSISDCKSEIITWCPTLSSIYRIMYYLWEACKLTAREAGDSDVSVWRLMYALISSFNAESEIYELAGNPQSDNFSISSFLSLLPRPIAVALQVSVIESAARLPNDIIMSENRESALLSAVKSRGVPLPLWPRVASMDTLILMDRFDIALNSMSSIEYVKKYQLPKELFPWEDAILASSLRSWRQACEFKKRSQILLESEEEKNGSSGVEKYYDLDGLEQLLKSTSSRFPSDERVREACRMVDSKKEHTLRVVRTPDMDDAAYKVKLQSKLLSICRRTLSSSVGRGMMTLSSMSALMAEALPTPPLTVEGRVPPMGTLMTVNALNAEMMVWPEFHNGVAAGLRVRSALYDGFGSEGSLMQIYHDVKQTGLRRHGSHFFSYGTEFGVSSTQKETNSKSLRYWILYNRTVASGRSENVHAGFLLAFGLLGHLRVLTASDICKFLTLGHQPTSIAMLLGLGASHLGTSDIFISKTICLHIPSLLPPGHGASDLDIPILTQTAAITALGLLNAGSGNRTMAEFLLSELTRKPTSEKNVDFREVYAISASWALGMLAIARGSGNKKDNTQREENNIVSDLKLDVRLLRCIEGGHGSAVNDDTFLSTEGTRFHRSSNVPNSYATDSNTNSSTVIEPIDSVNIAVTSFGAIIALALIYIRSENDIIASRLQVPDTIYAIEAERPDILFVRALATCLIQWKRLEQVCSGDPAGVMAWLNKQIPKVFFFFY